MRTRMHFISVGDRFYLLNVSTSKRETMKIACASVYDVCVSVSTLVLCRTCGCQMTAFFWFHNIVFSEQLTTVWSGLSLHLALRVSCFLCSVCFRVAGQQTCGDSPELSEASPAS